MMTVADRNLADVYQQCLRVTEQYAWQGCLTSLELQFDQIASQAISRAGSQCDRFANDFITAKKGRNANGAFAARRCKLGRRAVLCYAIPGDDAVRWKVQVVLRRACARND